MMVPTGEADLRMPELGSYIDPKIVNAAAELLRKYNLCAYNVPGDGSCMLHALKLCLAYQGVRCPSAEELRRIATRIAAEMWIKDPHGFGVHVAHSLKVNDSDEPFPNFEAYLAAASQPDCALGHVELHALAEHFKFCALVHSTESQEVITVGSNASVTIDVLHVNGNHYMALLPLQAPAKVTPVKDKPVKTSSKKNASKKTPFRHPCIAEPADIDDRLRRQEITHRKHCGVYNTFVVSFPAPVMHIDPSLTRLCAFTGQTQAGQTQLRPRLQVSEGAEQRAPHQGSSACRGDQGLEEGAASGRHGGSDPGRC